MPSVYEEAGVVLYREFADCANVHGPWHVHSAVAAKLPPMN
jgi:hypothetical protein